MGMGGGPSACGEEFGVGVGRLYVKEGGLYVGVGRLYVDDRGLCVGVGRLYVDEEGGGGYVRERVLYVGVSGFCMS